MYNKTIRLEDNEVPAVVNLETGEIKQSGNRPNNLPEGKVPFGINEIGWQKSFKVSWEFLQEELTPIEINIVMKLVLAAQPNTNSLEPLSDSITAKDLGEKFTTSRDRVKKIFKKLFDIGIYATFNVSEEGKAKSEYWILNPYLAFEGRLIESDIAQLFSKTRLTKEYFKRSPHKKNKYK